MQENEGARPAAEASTSSESLTARKYSLVHRNVPDVPEPERRRLPHEEAFLPLGTPCCAAIQKHFLKEGRLLKEDALSIIHMATRYFQREPNLLRLSPPMTGT